MSNEEASTSCFSCNSNVELLVSSSCEIITAVKQTSSTFDLDPFPILINAKFCLLCTGSAIQMLKICYKLKEIEELLEMVKEPHAGCRLCGFGLYLIKESDEAIEEIGSLLTNECKLLKLPILNSKICFPCYSIVKRWNQILIEMKGKLSLVKDDEIQFKKRKLAIEDCETQSKIIKLNEGTSSIPLSETSEISNTTKESNFESTDKYTIIKSRSRLASNANDNKSGEGSKNKKKTEKIDTSQSSNVTRSRNSQGTSESSFNLKFFSPFELPEPNKMDEIKAKFKIREFSVNIPVYSDDKFREIMQHNKPKSGRKSAKKVAKKKKASGRQSKSVNSKTTPKNVSKLANLIENVECVSQESFDDDKEQDEHDPLNITLNEDEIPISENVVVGGVKEFVSDPNYSISLPELEENEFDSQVNGIVEAVGTPMTQIFNLK